MKYRRLTPKDRYQIEAYLKSGLGVRAISRNLGFSASSISRELRRLDTNTYSADWAQEIASIRSSDRRRGRFKIKGKLKEQVRSKIKIDWSPEQIAGRFKVTKKGCISHQSIYRFIEREKEVQGVLWKHLRILRKQRKDRKKIGWKPAPHAMRNGRIDIEKRPRIVDKRKRLGDVERDTVFGKANGPLLLTIVDRVSRRSRIELVSEKCSEKIHRATVKALRIDKVLTITNDNGTEFTRHRETREALGAKVYFSKAYRSWERGTNENTNGLIRQYCPRKTSLTGFTKRRIKQIQRRLNTRPRKCLGFKTPLEVHKI